MSKKNYDKVFEQFKLQDEDIEEFRRPLGRGAFGEVREVLIGSKIYAAKLVEKEKSDNLEPERLRGANIIKIVKICEREIDKSYYDLIIMEKAVLKDIGTLISFISDKNLLKLINNPFIEVIGDNLLRFFVKQIIVGLETLDRSELVHFDIKPENLLISSGLNLKISDFSFLKNIRKSEKEFKIPGGTHGYVSPEYYKRKKINGEIAKKQDYFALGATIYYLKFCHRFLKFKKYDEDVMNYSRIIDLLHRNIDSIKANLILNKDFVDFLCSLVAYSPSQRPTFEQIYRSPWLNKNKIIIKNIIHSFSEGEEDKLMRELFKSDFLIDKQNDYKKCRKSKFRFVGKKHIK